MDEFGEHDDELIEVPIGDTFDLHPFQPRDVGDVVREYLEQARAHGFRQVRIIHGRGIGVQREIVRSLLASLPWVVEYADADPSGGGWGATVVVLAPVAE
ncbi:MAG: Smr/MutS family protein [Acidobacteria bacterium]|nr:Smr/MutS family protein [Acidobacteriota bacterium]